MGKNPCFNRGTWSAEEDKILTDYVHNYGEGKWSNVCRRSGLKRSGKSCRLRWLNYLRPDIKRGNISEDEENLIIRLHNLLGNRWSLIAGRLPGRTDNEIKNYWKSYLKKKVVEEQKTVVDSKKQLQIPTKKIQSNEVIMNSQPQVEKIAESKEKACSTSSSSSSAIIKREDSSNLLLDVDINDKWWERCYDSVDIFESSNRLNFPESTAETELHVLKNIETLEYGNPCDPSLLNHPFDLTNLSKFLELE